MGVAKWPIKEESPAKTASVRNFLASQTEGTDMADLVPHKDFRDPNWDWGPGPSQSPCRPPKTNRECKRQMVWPRDKDQEGAHSWRRWKDVFAKKGPNIWVQKQGDDGPHRPTWTNWTEYDNRGYRYKPEIGPPLDGPKKYDFKSRKYVIPHDGVWSDVKWDRRGRTWLYMRNRYGDPETRQAYKFMQDPIERRCRRMYGLEPFDYNPHTPHWDWRFNEKPWNWWPKTMQLWY
ncbi:MAG: hypothetical protein Q9218_002524 [Villophora microphyllina]